MDGIGPLQFINNLKEAKRDADGWGLNMEQHDQVWILIEADKLCPNFVSFLSSIVFQEPAWMDEGFLNLHDGSNSHDSDLQVTHYVYI